MFIEYVYVVFFMDVVEMIKLFENIFCVVNIGFVNEVVFMCYILSIDIWEVIEVVSIKFFGFMLFYSGLGLGGYCILIDLFYLLWKLCLYNYIVCFVELV